MSDIKKTSEPAGKSLVERIPSSLTKAVSTRARSAFKHLVGVYAPGVLSKAQSNKDERDAMSAITAAVASAAADKARTDPALADRMVERWAREELQKQENREAVALGTIEHLENGDSADVSDQPIDEDWLNFFGSHAERATSESIRDIWSRVLSGEIRRPGTFSLITMQFVSLLDKNSAQIVSSVLPYVINNEWIPRDSLDEKAILTDIIFLEELGFLSGSSGTLSVTISAEDHGRTVVDLGKNGLVIDNEKRQINLGAYPLSLAGQQFCQVIKEPIDLDHLIEIFKKMNPKTIEIGDIVHEGESSVVINLTTKFVRSD